MKRLLPIIVGWLTAMGAWATYIVPDTYQVILLNDSVFLFVGQPELKTSDGTEVDWYLTTDLQDPVCTNNSYCSSFSSGDGVVIKRGTEIIDVAYVFDYTECQPTVHSLSAQMDCGHTHLYIDATVPAMSYRDIQNRQHTIAHKATVGYTNLEWQEKAWAEVTKSHEFDLKQGVETINDPAYGETSFSLVWDKAWREQLGLAVDSMVTEIYEPLACRGKLVTQTTIRGTEEENEVDRPIDQKMLAASGPLEVSFTSNPTPGVRFYQWRIYKRNDLIAERKDQDIRYTFNDPGADLYKVVLVVRGDSCSQETDPSNPNYADSVNITIQKSQLFAPNVFTPNGDGKNDEFRVIYTSIKEYYIWIYNRWGKLVYESSDPAKGWDGNIGSRAAAEGAYYYIIRAKGTDADTDPSNPNLGVYNLSGDINLLR